MKNSLDSEEVVFELDKQYLHRNGETDDPEVQGWYWVIFKRPDGEVYLECFEWNYPNSGGKWGVMRNLLDGNTIAIYGPVPEPFEWREKYG